MDRQDSLVTILIASLTDDLASWEFGEHCAEHLPSRLKLWIANGIWFLEVYQPTKMEFSFFQKLRLWPVVRQARAIYLTKLMLNSKT